MNPAFPLAERIVSGQGPDFADLLESLAEAIIIRDRDGRYLYANQRALRMYGFETVEEMREIGLAGVIDRFVVHDDRGRPVMPEDLPSARLLRGETPEPLLTHSVDHRTGEARWQQLKASPLRDADGRVIATVTIVEDVTPLKTAEVHTRVLAESGRVLASSLDYEQTLHNVANVAVPGLADWCMVELLDSSGRREHTVIAHRDARRRELAMRMRQQEPPVAAPHQAISRVVASGESLLFFDVDDAHLQRVARTDEQLELLRALEIRSAIVVPMRVPNRIIGAMSFFTSESRRRLTDDDVALAEQLGRRAAVAVENSRMHTQLTEVAETLQRSLRPRPLPKVAGWEVAALYRPAEPVQRIEVGGDFYEVFEAGACSLALIGDVTGHGVQAATLTGLMRHGARFASRLEPDPVAIIRRLDEELREGTGTAMCSALCAALEEHSIVLCSAGHPPALIASGDGTVTEAPVPGPLLGAFTDSTWHQERVRLDPGDLVLLYTDGVTETAELATATADRPTERFGSERLRRLLTDHAGASPQELLDHLQGALYRFRGDAPDDDVAALALRLAPES